MSGGGGGVGGPTVSHEPGVKKEPLLIAGVVGDQMFIDVTGEWPTSGDCAAQSTHQRRTMERFH